MELIERIAAIFGSLLVGGTAALQLKNEWTVHGLDAAVTKLLLGLMIIGCVLAFFAGLDVLGNFG